MLVNYLAELWGYSLLIICLVLLIKPKQINKLWQAIEQDGILFLAGFLTLVLGIASVLGYNVWSKSWTVIITILGWLTLIKGAVILFLPETMKSLYSKIMSKNESLIPVALLVGVIIGCYLIYAGYTL